MSTLIRIAIRNVRRGWRRSTIVIAAIAFGLAACIVMMGWSNGMVFQMVDNVVRSHLAHVVVQAQGYQDDPQITRALGVEAAELMAVLEGPGVHLAPRLQGEGLVQSARKSLRAIVVGVDPAREPGVSVVPSQVSDGAYLSSDPAGPRRRLPQIVIGAEMAERLDAGVGEKLVLHVPGENGAGAFRVAGIYTSSSSDFELAFVYLELEAAQALFAAPGSVTQVAAVLDEVGAEAAFRDRARETLAGALPDAALEVLTWQDRDPVLSTLITQMSGMGWIIYALVFIATAFGIANALLMAVYERIREFGVMRSLGLRANRVVSMVLAESVVMTLVGTAAGLALGIALTLWLGEVGVDLSVYADGLRSFGAGAVIFPRLATADIGYPIALAIVTALVAGLWPALRAVKLQPAEAIRHT